MRQVGADGLEFVRALQAVVGSRAVGLREPVFGGNEKRYLQECIDTGYVSSTGPFVARFENDLADYAAAHNVIAVVNGTAALHLALVALGIKPGDEVIVPALTFVATANAVAMAGAVPHFVDVSWETWGISAEKLRSYLSELLQQRDGSFFNRKTGRPVTAVVPMHTLGFLADADGVAEVAKEFGLALVEDAAEALGSFVGGVHAGLAGQAGVFSFNGNKTITTGGGGAIITRDSSLAKRIRHLATTAKLPHRYEFEHDIVGYNYRMPNLNAALGVAQLEQLPAFLERQRTLHLIYAEALDSLEMGFSASERPGTVSNYWLQAFVLDSNCAESKNAIIETCLDNEIAVRPLWKPLNRLAAHHSSPSDDTPVADELYSRVICLPSSPKLAS